MSKTFRIISNHFIRQECIYVVEQKKQHENLYDLLMSIDCKNKYSCRYNKVYARYIWSRILGELVKLKGASCVTKSLAMYRIATFLGWDAKVFFALSENWENSEYGHAYVQIFDDYYGYDKKRTYKIVFEYKKGEIYGFSESK